MGLKGLHDSHVRVLVNVFALTGISFNEHPFLYEMSSVPCKNSFSAGFYSYQNGSYGLENLREQSHVFNRRWCCILISKVIPGLRVL